MFKIVHSKTNSKYNKYIIYKYNKYIINIFTCVKTLKGGKSTFELDS